MNRQTMQQRPESDLFYDHKDVTGADSLALADPDLFYFPRLWRLQLVLHLHCLNDNDTIAFFDLGSRFDQEPDHLSGHCGTDLGGAATVFRILRRTSQAFGIDQSDLKIDTACLDLEAIAKNAARRHKHLGYAAVAFEEINAVFGLIYLKLIPPAIDLGYDLITILLEPYVERLA